MQVSRSPTARCTSTAATDESTPPESPQMTRRSGPTASRMRAISVSTKCPGVQSAVQPQTSNRKLLRISPPARRVRHLGVELHAEQRPRGVLEGGDRRVVAARGDPVPVGRDVHVVAVAHPDRRLLAPAEAAEQPPALDRHAGAAVLAPATPASRCPPRGGPAAACRSRGRAPGARAPAAPGRPWARSRRTPSSARRSG